MRLSEFTFSNFVSWPTWRPNDRILAFLSIFLNRHFPPTAKVMSVTTQEFLHTSYKTVLRLECHNSPCGRSVLLKNALEFPRRTCGISTPVGNVFLSTILQQIFPGFLVLILSGMIRVINIGIFPLKLTRRRHPSRKQRPVFQDAQAVARGTGDKQPFKMKQ